MAQSFTTMQTTICENIQDTTNEMKIIVGYYINDRYKDIFRRTNWETMDEDYTVTTSAGTQDYTLATDFKKEIYVYDSTNKKQLSRITMNDYADNFLENATQDAPESYIILDVMSTDSPPVRTKKIRFVQTPADTYTINIPYNMQPVDLSGTSYPIIPCEQAIINGATASAQRYKRQYAKAGDYEAMYERDIQMLMWDKDNQPNQVHTFTPATYNRNDLY